MDKESLTSAVREGRIEKVRELVNLFSLFYGNDVLEGYELLLVALEKNHRDIAKLLVLNGAKVYSNNDYTITPLHYAAMHGNVDIVKMLLDRNAKVDAKDKYGGTPLHHAIGKNHIKTVKLLLNRNAYVNTSDRDGMTPLHIASKEYSTELVKILLNYGAYINPTTYLTPRQNFREGYTPLHHAVEKGSREIVKLLLKNNTDVNIKALRGTPLHIAAEEGYPQIVEDLLNHGANVNSVCTSTGYTPLHLASTTGNMAVIILLLNKGADVNAVTKDNLMPLSIATQKGHGIIVKLLLEHGADANGQNTYVNYKTMHVTPLHIAAQKGFQQIVEYLLNHGASVHSVCTSTGCTPLHFASANGSMGVVEWILSKGADVDARGNDGRTPLYLATDKGHDTVVKLLLEHGADVDAQDASGKTILHLAVERGYSNIIEDILMFCPNLRNKSNKNALNIAIYNVEGRYRKIVENLLEYGFTVNTKDINNCKLVHAAVKLGYLEVVEDLLQNGADINMKYLRGETLLHSATFYQREEMAELLIRYGADVNAKDKFYKTPIAIAVENLDLNITKLLLTNGANLKNNPDLLKAVIKFDGCIEIIEVLLQHNSHSNRNGCNKYGETTSNPTILDNFKGATTRSRATRANARKRSRLLNQVHLDNRTIVNAKKEDGTTALHVATYRGHEKIVEILLKYGAEVDSRTKGDMTPLHIAAQCGYPKIIDTLLKFGANIDSVDKYDRSALHIACEGRHGDVVEALLQNGADVNILSKDNLTALDFAVPGTGLFYWQLEARYNDYDSDIDDEFYEEVDHRGIHPRDEIAEIMFEHLAKMRAENLFVNKKYAFTIETNPMLKSLYENFETEIKRMENTKIGNTNISFYDVLTRGAHQLAMYTRNKSIVKIFDSREYIILFPRYADVLENQFKKGKERKSLLRSSIQSFNSLFGYELPHLFLNEMFSYLSNLDLKHLIDAHHIVRS